MIRDSLPGTPTTHHPDDPSTPVAANGVAESLEAAISNGSTTPKHMTMSSGPGSASPTSPGTPSSPSTPFRRGHGRQASLGTTMTSPSTRRRSLESTMSLIQGVWDGKGPIAEGDESVEGLAAQLAGSSVAPGAGGEANK